REPGPPARGARPRRGARAGGHAGRRGHDELAGPHRGRADRRGAGTDPRLPRARGRGTLRGVDPGARGQRPAGPARRRLDRLAAARRSHPTHPRRRDPLPAGGRRRVRPVAGGTGPAVLQALARSELAIDLGTAATRLHAHPRTVPLTRPSVVWRGGGTRPALARGVVVDGDAAADGLGDLLRKVGCGWRRPRAVACVPSDASDAEQDAVLEAVRRAGAARVALVPEPLAAAVGAGIEVGAPRAQALVDIGEGVTDCAVVC